MSKKSRLEKLEQEQETSGEQPLTWKELIERARRGEYIPGWNEFISSALESGEEKNEQEKQA